MSAPWWERGACRHDDPNRWVPRGGKAELAALRELKPICDACPVRQECLDDALDMMRRGEAAEGVRGGTTTGQRRKMAPAVRQLKPIVHGTNSGYRLHLDRGEKACEECSAAAALRATGYREARRRGAA